MQPTLDRGRLRRRRLAAGGVLAALLGAGLAVVNGTWRSPTPAAGASCNNTGVTQNPDGTFSYSQLSVNTNGNIVDPSGCIVSLVGFNYGWLDSSAVDIQETQGGIPNISSWKQSIPLNVVRVAVNSYWYDNNYVPPNYSGQTVPQLLDQFIKDQQAAGNYVEIDIAQQFSEKPCMPQGNDCPAQNQADLDWNKYVKGGGTGCPAKWPEGWIFHDSDTKAGPISNCPPAVEEESYQPYALQALTTLAQQYGNNPGVIFDVWNEPLDANVQGMSYDQWLEAINKRISTVRQYTSNLIDVFGNSIYDDLYPSCPFSGSNLAIDFHTYKSDFNGQQVHNTFVPGFQKCHYAFQINEYGSDTYSQTVQQAMILVGTADHVGSLYFDPGYLGRVGTYQNGQWSPATLNAIGNEWGTWVQQCNQQIIGPLGYQPSPSTTTTSPSTSTSTTTPTSTSSTTSPPPTSSTTTSLTTTTLPPTTTTQPPPPTTSTTTTSTSIATTTSLPATTTTTQCAVSCNTTTTLPTTTTQPPPTTSTTLPPPPHGPGYWMLDSGGNVYNFGSAPGYESATPFNGPSGTAVAIVARPDGEGYWVLDSGNSVYNVGYAPELVPVPLTAITLVTSPEVGIASTSDGQGFWVVTTTGQVLTGGDANPIGDLSGVSLNAPIINMVPTPDNKGYWLLGADGGVFAFGNAAFYGSTGAMRLNKPVVGMAVTADGHGYWLVASDGGIFTFGDAAFLGSMGSVPLNAPVSGMVPTSDGNGYWMVAQDGGVFTFGDAGFVGSLGGSPPSSPIVGITPS